MTQIPLDDIIQMASIISFISGTVATVGTLAIDFYRRAVRVRTAEYAAKVDFDRIINTVEYLQTTIENQSKVHNDHHDEIRERVSRIEGRLQPWLEH